MSVMSNVFFEVAEEVLRRGHRVRFRAEGASMHPTIRAGETITVKPASPAELEVGDIALYRTERGVIAHRVIRRHTHHAAIRYDAGGAGVTSTHRRADPAVAGSALAANRDQASAGRTKRSVDHSEAGASRTPHTPDRNKAGASPGPTVRQDGATPAHRRADPWVGLAANRDEARAWRTQHTADHNKAGASRTPHSAVCHEAGASPGPTFIMRGDAASSTDEPVSPQQILGKVVAVERHGRDIDLDTRRAIMKNFIQVCAFRCKRWFISSLASSLRSPAGAGTAALPLALVALVLAFPGTTRAQVTVQSFGSSGYTTSTSNTTVTLPLNLYAFSSSSSTYLIVGLTVHGNHTTATATWSGGGCTGSQNFTEAKSINSGASTAIMLYLQQPNVPSTNSTCNLTATYTTDNNTDAVIGAVAFTGVSSISYGSAVNSGGNKGSPTSGNITVPTTNADGTAMAVLGSHNNACASASNQTLQWSTSVSCTTDVANGAGATTMSTGSQTFDWTLASNAPDWAMVWAILTAATPPTAVGMRSFKAVSTAVGNQIEFKTAREVSSLGFNLYREQNGERVRLNSSLLAGTALLAGPKTEFTAGQVHTWWDVPPAGATGVEYWVEEVDVNGQRTMYGPARPEPGVGPGLAPARLAQEPAQQRGGPTAGTMMLNEVGRVGAPGSGVNSMSHPFQARARVGYEAVASANPTINQAGPMPMQTPTTTNKQYALAASQAVKIGIQSEGWYSVSQSELVAAGFNPNANVNTLQLWAEGVQQPLYIHGQTSGKLSATGDIEFYGTGIDTTWSLTRVYWLTWGQGSTLPVQSETLNRRGSFAPSSFPFTIEWMPRTVYFAALLNGDADNFFGPVLDSGDPVTQPLTVSNYNAASAEMPSLAVTLQGGILGPHSVAVELNGYAAGTVTWNDLKEGVGTFAIPDSTLINGQNILTLTAGGSDDVSVVDNVQLTYPHTYTADSDYVKFTLQGGDLVTIGGFNNSAISVVDVTNPTAVTIVPGTTTHQGGSYAVTIVPQGAGTRTLLALTSAQIGQPVSVTANHPSSWHSAQAGYDMVMITDTALFGSSLTPLVKLRQSQGRKVAVIDVTDLYDEFNYGEKTPYALKNFLSTANTQWHLKPHFVLLAGDATFDPKNYLKQGNYDLVPTYLVDTSLLETASDDWFSDFSNTGLPQMAEGRLPVRTAAECSTQVNKIVTYDQSGSSVGSKRPCWWPIISTAGMISRRTSKPLPGCCRDPGRLRNCWRTPTPASRATSFPISMAARRW